MSSFFKDFFDLRDAVKEAVDPIKGDIKALTEDVKGNLNEIQDIVTDPQKPPDNQDSTPESTGNTSQNS